MDPVRLEYLLFGLWKCEQASIGRGKSAGRGFRKGSVLEANQQDVGAAKGVCPGEQKERSNFGWVFFFVPMDPVRLEYLLFGLWKCEQASIGRGKSAGRGFRKGSVLEQTNRMLVQRASQENRFYCDFN